MDILHERCAGVDISKRDAEVCVRLPGRRTGQYSSTVTTWPAMTNSIIQLRDHLLDQQVTLVVMEATGDYWKAFYYLLEDGLNVELVNARQVKNMPGRKTDVSDAAWLAQLGAYGLVRASFVPPEPIRQLRDLTRTRSVLIRARAHEVQRVEKELEDSGIKLSSVASDLLGISSRSMLEALINGERDPGLLADMARQRMRSRIPELTEALTGRFTGHHGFLISLHLDLIDAHTCAIAHLDARINTAMEPYLLAQELLVGIPGISQATAQIIIAETGGDMSTFPTAAQLASWAGTVPGSNESAGRIKSAKTRPGNPYLKAALGIAAMSVSRSRTTYFSAKYRRIAARRGPIRALVAVQHSMLLAIWHILTTGEVYRDPGPDYYTQRRPAQAVRRAIAQIQSLGFNVTIEPAT